MKCWSGLIALGLLAGCAWFQSQPLSLADTAASLESHTLGSPELKSFLEISLGRELKPWPAARRDFEMLTLAAFYYQPSLDVARAAWAGPERGRGAAATERPPAPLRKRLSQRE